MCTKFQGLVFGRVSPASVGPELNGPNQQTRCSVQHQGSECPFPISAQTLLAINRVYLLEAALDTGQVGGSAHGTRDPHSPFSPEVSFVPPACSQLLLPRRDPDTDLGTMGWALALPHSVIQVWPLTRSCHHPGLQGASALPELRPQVMLCKV